MRRTRSHGRPGSSVEGGKRPDTSGAGLNPAPRPDRPRQDPTPPPAPPPRAPRVRYPAPRRCPSRSCAGLTTPAGRPAGQRERVQHGGQGQEATVGVLCRVDEVRTDTASTSWCPLSAAPRARSRQPTQRSNRGHAIPRLPLYPSQLFLPENGLSCHQVQIDPGGVMLHMSTRCAIYATLPVSTHVIRRVDPDVGGRLGRRSARSTSSARRHGSSPERFPTARRGLRGLSSPARSRRWSIAGVAPRTRLRRGSTADYGPRGPSTNRLHRRIG